MAGGTLSLDDFTGATTSKAFYAGLCASLKSERATFDSHWRELADVFVPTRARFLSTQRNQGGKRNQQIIDSTGRFAARTLASGLHAGLTSPARPWFTLSTADPELARYKPVKDWLQDVTDRMNAQFTDANLYNALPVLYMDLGIFGTGCMSMLEDTEDLFRCTVFPIGSYALGLDARGLANTFTREYELSVFQVVEQFGVMSGYRDIDWSRVSTTVRALWDKGQYQAPVPLTWVVVPNRRYRPEAIDAKHKRWFSCHFEMGDGADRRFLRESGFDSFPIVAPRWDITGDDTYGTDSPGMTALGDNRQLQGMEREKAKAIAKMVTPPLKGSVELRTAKVSAISGDITYVKDPNAVLGPIYETRLNLQDLHLSADAVRYRIQRAFYEDLFLMLAQSDARRGSQPITAREVEERHEEKLLALGPVLERLNDECLDRVVDRTFLLMERAGMIPEAPDEVQGQKLKVQYVSIMAQAQKMVGVSSLDRFVMATAPMLQVDPSLRHKIDGEKVIDGYQEMLGVDSRLVRSPEEFEQRVTAEQQMIQAQQQAEIARTVAQTGKDLAQTPAGQGSALDALVGAGAGA